MDPLSLVSVLLPLVAPLPYHDVAPFVELLASRDRDHRTCAEHVLRHCGDRVEGNLEWAYCRHPSPAVRRAAERLLIDLDWLPSTPWIDFPATVPERWNLMNGYLWRARECGADGGPPDWPDYRVATVLLMRDLRRAGISAIHRLELLSFMSSREVDWWVTHRGLD